MHKLIETDGGVCEARGFYADGIHAGLKNDNALDMAFIYCDTTCNIASVFTTNKMCAAPIKHFQRYGEFRSNFVLINSKNANAMTGSAGIDDIDDILNSLNSEKIVNPIMSSTGVIGVRVPKQKLIDGTKLFDLTQKNSQNASKAIMTTDAFSKTISYRVELEDGKSFSIGAIAKGAGMINPAMATMLCFITTDADVPKDELQEHLDIATKSSFNAISVDGDTSTNDTVLLLANGESGSYNKEAFGEALHVMMKHLALLMVKDGEGATKVVTYDVSGALNDGEAETAAKALSNSLLMKTALFGEDPNWGRVASTIGASGTTCSEESLSIKFDNILVYDCGKLYFDEENEKRASEVMKKESFTISCNLGQGNGSFEAYGCDLGYEYVKINADYRT
ncbi:MAG: bifunctional glutamate N-acetyltransferase/amino-acid acetyltransferase ArgJ [Campylobacterota bacterium]|nr:bifunctional glutamate N-acetyltransferase/amino-acid acetyltransferase ArgJ [Campylobacterota bacterium]